MKLSVIIPVFNTPPSLIDQCLNSVLWQTLGRSLFEVILVDDCSTDHKTLKYLHSLREQGLVRVTRHTRNRGLALSRKTGVIYATGEFVTFVDSDDLLGNKALEVFYHTALRNKADVITSRMRRIGFDCKYWYDVGISHKSFNPKDRDARLLQLFSETYTFSMCGRLYKKAFLDLNMFDAVAQRLHEDLLVTTDCVFRATLVEHINYPAYYYRETPGSITQRITSRHIKDLFLTFSDWYKIVAPLNNFAISEALPVRVYAFLRMIVNRVFSQHDSSMTHEELLLCLASQLREFSCSIDYERLHVIHASFAAGLKELANVTNNGKSSFALKSFVQTVQTPQTATNGGARAFPDFDGKVVFVCEVDYHFEQAYYLGTPLAEAGLGIVLLDNSKIASGGKRRVPLERYTPLENMSFYLNDDERLDYKSLGSAVLVVMFNDYNKTIEEALQYRSFLRKPSISFVEGINDFKRVDSKVYRERPYRKSMYVCVPGVYDLQYFPDRVASVVGMPKIEELYFGKSPSISEDTTSGFRVAINLNFTYGILEDQRERFFTTALAVCGKLKLKVKITQHPADKANVPQDLIWKGSQNELIRQSDVFISRFATGILEALAVGTPVIYYNPHSEKVAKFKEPMGAFAVANNADQLESALKQLMVAGRGGTTKEVATAFLRTHCNLKHLGACAEQFASIVKSILADHRATRDFVTDGATTTEQVAAPTTEPEASRSTLAEANSLFREKRYSEALRIYEKLHEAYCLEMYRANADLCKRMIRRA